MDPERRAQRQELVKGRILDAARALVVKHGHERVSLRAVARRARLSPASLYEYFDGKEALLGALAMRANQRLTLVMQGAVRSRRREPEVVRVCEAYVGFARDNPEDFLLLFSRTYSQRRSLAQAVPQGSAYTILQRAVQGALASGALVAGRGQGAEHVTYCFWACAHGMATLQLTFLKGFDTDFPTTDRGGLRALWRGFSTE